MNSIEAWTHKLLEQPVLTRCRIEVDYTLCCSFTDKCKKTKQEASAKYAALSCNKGVFRFKNFSSKNITSRCLDTCIEY